MFKISISIYFIATLASFGFYSANADEAKDALIVQTVLKLESFDYEKSSSKVKEAISRYLEQNVGTDEYYTLVEKFLIEGQIKNLQIIFLNHCQF